MSLAPIVIIGAGKAGLAAATTLRERGYAGEIAIATDEPGVPYDRPPLSKAFLTEKARPDRSLDLILDHATLASLNISWLPAAVSIDRAARKIRFGDGRQQAYHKLLLATGASARKLRTPGAEHVHTLRDLHDAVRLREAFAGGKRIAIIGGGFIGLELAASARTLGATVTVIEAQPRVLMRGVPTTIAAAVAERHASAGVEILTGTGIEKIEPGRVVLPGGRAVPADTVIAGIGAEPRVDLAKAAGLHLDNGIAVDQTARTSDPDIFAAGDCCSFLHPVYGDRRIRLESWRHAQDHGAAAAAHMLGGAPPFETVPWFWSDQYDLTLQIAGLAQDAARTISRPQADGAILEFHLAADGRLLAASGIGPGNVVAKDIKLSEMLISKRARPDPAKLADPTINLKSLLKAS